MFNSLCASRGWRIIVLALALTLPGLVIAAAKDVPLTSLIPLDSPGMASIDLPWLWKSTAFIRVIPEVRTGINSAEDEVGLSFEKDLLPWAGQVAFAMTDFRDDGPSWAIYLQIRDAGQMIKSAQVEAILQEMLHGDPNLTWLALEYKGVPIRRIEVERGHFPLKVATATLDNWFVIAFGDGVIRKVIDTRQGAAPSLEKHPLFARAMAGLPAGAPGQFCVNGQGILTQIEKLDDDAAREIKKTQLETYFVAGAVTYPGEIRFDTVYCTASPKTQATLKWLRADAGTVTGASLAQLPEDTSIALLVSKPDAWVSAVKQLLLDSAPDDDLRDEIREGFAQLDGLRAVLQRCAGEVGAGLVWRQDKGGGGVIAARTDVADITTAAAAAFRNFLEGQNEMVEMRDDLYTIPSTKSDNKIFPSLACWTARDKWLLGASHPDWLAQPAEKPPLALPESARDANLAVFGDYSFILSWLTAIQGAFAGDDIAAKLKALRAGDEKWVYTIKIDEDGGAIHSRLSGALPIMTASAILYPMIARAREKARTVASMSNLRQLASAATMYAQDHDELWPEMKTAGDMPELLMVDAVILVSPRTNEPYQPNPFIAGKSIGEIDDPISMIIFYENTPAPDGSRCVAYLDGHVGMIPAADWDAAKNRAKMP